MEREMTLSIKEDKTQVFNRERISTIILFVVLQLQVFRRLSSFGYALILVVAYVFWFSSISLSRLIRAKIICLLFLVCYLFLPMISIVTCTPSEYFTAIVRYGALMPLLVVCITNSRVIYDHLADIVRTYIYIVVISALLLLYQLFFGRISFFVDPSERAGFVRYGTLLGSVTSYGGSAAVAILFLHNFDYIKGWKKTVCEVLIIVGGILSLSKACILNFAICYALCFIFRPEKRIKTKIATSKVIKIAIGLGMTFLIMFILIKYTFIGNYFRSLIQYTFMSSHAVTGDLENRITSKPFYAFEYHGNPWYYYIFFGVGFKGYAGIMGLSQYPMCHNNIFDVILSQGSVSLFSLLAVYISAFMTSLRKRDAYSCIVKKLVPYRLANMLAGTGTFLTIGGMLTLCIIISIYQRDVYRETIEKKEIEV